MVTPSDLRLVGWLVGWLEFNIPFQHIYNYIKEVEVVVRGRELSSYPVKEGERYISFSRGHLFVQQPPKKGKGSRSSFKLLC